MSKVIHFPRHRVRRSQSVPWQPEIDLWVVLTDLRTCSPRELRRQFADVIGQVIDREYEIGKIPPAQAAQLRQVLVPKLGRARRAAALHSPSDGGVP